MKNIYQCENILYRHVKGGGIGARITGVIARIIMDVWANKISSILEDNSILIYLLVKYVEDINITTSLIPEVTMWVKSGRKWTLKYSNGQKEVDREEAKSP